MHHKAKPIFQSILVILLISGSCNASAFAQATEEKVYISEIVASNSHGFPDQFNKYPDWIEIHNNTRETVNLNSWSLTDSKTNLHKWTFPSVNLASGGYLVVFASGENIKITTSYLHTSFSLSAEGEFLALINDKGEVVSGFADGYPVQYTNVSYSFVNGKYTYVTTPTPGKANSSIEYLLPPLFSHPRGICDAPFDLALTTLSEGTTIRYTTDGSEPTTANGIVYSVPLKIEKTSVIRAACMKESTVGKSVTYSYLFLPDVIQQPALPEGYPATWGTNVPADYEMDPEITEQTINRNEILKALNTLPIVSVVSNRSNFFSPINSVTEGGIYVYTAENWERPASFEIIENHDNLSRQVNCGVQLQGGESRRPEKSPKHSLQLIFRSEYGPSKLDYSLFEEQSAVQSFNSISLKAGFNNSWIHWDATQRKASQYMRDVWSKCTFREMGNKGVHTRYINLFINGLYWGLYNISEHIDSRFMESYLGGDESEYDVVKDNEGAIDGSVVEWNKLFTLARAGLASNANYYKIQGKNPDGSNNSAYPVYLDVANLSDYIILNFYGANQDWDHHNWVSARRKGSESKGFQFFVWDTERILESSSASTQDEFNKNCPSELFQLLKLNQEFKLQFADRVQKHLFHEGVLTPGTIIQNWKDRANQISSAVYAESARWGDYRRDVYPKDISYPIYTATNWQVEKDRLINNYFPQRTNILINQFKQQGLYPSLSAPEFNQYGGKVLSNFKLQISAPQGTIYYSLKGDPRMIGGQVSPDAIPYNSPFPMTAYQENVKARVKNGDVWSALTEAVFVTDFPNTIPPEAKVQPLRNYPNPVKTTTRIDCTLPESGFVQLVVFSIHGNMVDQLNLGRFENGFFTYNYDVCHLTSGVYVYKIKGAGFELKSRMIVLK